MLVSIIIPVFNREKIVCKAIDSALSQSYKNIEIIVIDNCSTDKTWDTLNIYAAKDDRVKIYRNESNIGPVKNWIAGISKAKGYFIKLLFSDDWLASHDIAENIKHISDDPSVGLVYNPAIIHNINSKAIFYNTYGHSKKVKSKTFVRKLLFNNNVPVSPCSAFFRRADLINSIRIDIPNKKGLDFSKLGAGNDLLIYLDVASKYPYIYFSDKICVNFSGHSGSITRRYNLYFFYKTARQVFIRESLVGFRKLLFSVIINLNIPFLFTVLNKVRSYVYKKTRILNTVKLKT